MDAPIALIVDDDANFAHSLAVLVKREGFDTRTAGSLAEARQQLQTAHPDAILLDMGLPDGDGLEFVRAEKASIGAEVIVITGQASVDSAVEALREGVLDYLVKPVDRARLKAVLAHVARTRALKHEVDDLRGEMRDMGRFGPMVGRSKAMQAVYDLIQRVAPTDASVMITGESGTGKELVAQTIHQLSQRRKNLLLPLNCGAVSPRPDRERAVRPRARQLHRRRSHAQGVLRAGERRHAVPRRDHRDAARPAGEAPAGARDRSPHARGREPNRSRRTCG